MILQCCKINVHVVWNMSGTTLNLNQGRWFITEELQELLMMAPLQVGPCEHTLRASCDGITFVFNCAVFAGGIDKRKR